MRSDREEIAHRASRTFGCRNRLLKPRGFGHIVEHDLPIAQRQVRDEVVPGNDLEHRQPSDVGDDVPKELQLGG